MPERWLLDKMLQFIYRREEYQTDIQHHIFIAGFKSLKFFNRTVKFYLPKIKMRLLHGCDIHREFILW